MESRQPPHVGGQRQIAELGMVVSSKEMFDVDEVDQCVNDMKNRQNWPPTMEDWDRFWKVDESLLDWLTSLAEKERKDSHFEATSNDVLRKRKICEFYFHYVPVIRAYLAKKLGKTTDGVKVFISFAKDERWSYAHGLYDFLVKNGVDGVFFDKKMPSGANPDYEILAAAVSCNCFWGVVTPCFVGRKWPMRELLIAYTRYMHEDQEHFRLLMDCLEMTDPAQKVGKSWMDQVRSMVSMKLFTVHGAPYSFPSNMEPFKSESYEQRRKRIAARVDLVQEADLNHIISAGNVETILRERIQRSEQVFNLMQTWDPTLPHYRDAILKAIHNGAEVRFLFLHFKSVIFALRNKAIKRSESIEESHRSGSLETIDSKNGSFEPISYERDGRIGIAENLKLIDRLKNSLPKNLRNKIQVRLYDSLPGLSLYRTDDSYISGHFFHGRLAVECPHHATDIHSEMGKAYTNEFKRVWDFAEEFDPKNWKDARPKRWLQLVRCLLSCLRKH